MFGVALGFLRIKNLITQRRRSCAVIYLSCCGFSSRSACFPSAAVRMVPLINNELVAHD